MTATAALALFLGWQTGKMQTDVTFREVFNEASTPAATPLVDNLESACTRVEALCGMTGKMSEALVTLIPITNISTNNPLTVHTVTIAGANLANIQAQTRTLTKRLDI